MKPLQQAAAICATTLFILAAVAAVAQGAELYLLGGVIKPSLPKERSYSWQLEYRQDLFKHLAAGVSYLNEGHIQQHHRDGYTVQLWTRTELVDSRLTLAAAAGPYFFLDTKSNSTAKGFENNHGWKAMMSATAAWHMENDLLLELRTNWVKGPKGFDSTSVLAGIGYYFEPSQEPLTKSARARELGPKNEVTAFLGQTIVNDRESQRSVAASLEYRRHLSRHIDWTLAWLYEGDNRVIRRDGVITQLWAVQPLLEDAMSVGAGAGAYFDVDHYKDPLSGSRSGKFISGIITLTGSYRFAPHWAVRASWNRVVTNYEKDTDVILAGLGYRF